MPCASCKPMPGVGTQMVNAAAATYRVATALVHGDALKARPETIAARQPICLACEQCVTIKKGDRIYHRCSDCSCWLDGRFFSKWSLATESCPLEKWRAE